MIEALHIKNFKSIYDLNIKTGRVNLFIGENGSGKSNLLEALVFVSASESNKLDNEFLVSRGIRVTEPTLMRSAFEEKDQNNDIKITLTANSIENIYHFSHENKPYSEWKNYSALDKLTEKSYSKKLKQQQHLKETLLEVLEAMIEAREGRKKIKETIIKVIEAREALIELIEAREAREAIIELNKKQPVDYKSFIVYSPENTALRLFSKEGQIQPLGINGEGLLKLLKVINRYQDKSHIKTIIESLQLFNWFEDIIIPTDISLMEDKVIIKDKYLYKEIDQRSANEGFLFILFYITLLVAKETPKAFAIDNIDASLNPKLCTKLMLIITSLAEKYDKQVFLTTHNPAILDGIDLNDKEQKLFVVSRNKSGHTRMKQISVKNKPKSSNDEPLLLSEAFLRGYLGGLPKGF